jgi:hypothetical protein
MVNKIEQRIGHLFANGFVLEEPVAHPVNAHDCLLNAGILMTDKNKGNA